MESMKFHYDDFTSRNIGFISREDQSRIRKAKIFIPGIGGMGGCALETLVRLGVENFIIADFDDFEVSNLNRQVFCTLETVGTPKVEASVKRIKSINPHIQVETWGKDWTDHLDTILPKVDFALNGCDDIKSTILLMRKAKDHDRTVIDAFASPLPSVYVVRPSAPRPEELMNFPTRNLAWEKIDGILEKLCQLQEVKYVLTHSSSHRHIIWDYALEVIQGKRKRFSLSPMVSMTGNLMAYEALKMMIGHESVVNEKGVFYNPWKARVEKPLPWFFAWIKGWMVNRHFR